MGTESLGATCEECGGDGHIIKGGDDLPCNECGGSGLIFKRQPSPIMRFFAYEHLPEKLQKISEPFGLLADELDAGLPNGAEKAAGLRKLLEAKDCMVRAALQ